MAGMEVNTGEFEASITPAMAAVRHEAFDIGERVADRWVEAAVELAPELKELDPRWVPGALKASIHRGPLEEHPGGARITVSGGEGLSRPWEWFTEYGTAKMRARPWFRPAAAIAETELRD
jgi:hypothetical protein